TKDNVKAQYRQLLTQPDAVRRKVAFTATRIDDGYQAEFLAVLLELLKHETVAIRREAACSLGLLRHSGYVELAPHLKDALQDKDETVRVWAATGLSKSEWKDQALPQLLAGLRHPQSEVRFVVRAALYDYGTGAKAALPVYLEWLKSNDPVE